MNNFAVYASKIWASRYFWWHLTLADLRAKFRRSFFGMAWSVFNPLFLTLLLTFVMGTVFHIPIADYAPYIFSGVIIWEYIISSAMTGCSALINAEGYIKQFRHPLAIYPLRSTLACLINFLLGFIGLLCWVAFWKPGNFGWTTFIIILAIPIYLFISWPLAIMTSFINTKFRDFSQLIVIVFQALWYTSPVFFQPTMFSHNHLKFLLVYNPIYHILNLVRAPLLYNRLPSGQDFIFTLGTALLLWLIAMCTICRQEKNMIFYL